MGFKMKAKLRDLVILTALTKMDKNKLQSVNDYVTVNALKQHLRHSYKKYTQEYLKDKDLRYLLRTVNKALNHKVNNAVVINDQAQQTQEA